MKKQMAMTIGISAAITFAMVFGLIFLSWRINGTVEQIKILKNELAFYFQITESLLVLRQNMDAIQPYTGEIDNILPTRDHLIKLPNELNLLAQQNFVSVKSELSGDNPKEQTGLKSVGLGINIDGPFGNIVNFLKSLEGDRYSIRISSFDLVKGGDNFKSAMGGKVFYF